MEDKIKRNLKIIIPLVVIMLCLSIIINMYLNSKTKIYAIYKFNVKQITIIDISKEKMKLVTSKKDINKLVNFTSSLKFKEVDKETSRMLEQENLKYHLIIEDRRNTAYPIVLNISNNMIFYMGKWYQVNLNAEDYISDQYKKLNYMEYGTLLNNK